MLPMPVTTVQKSEATDGENMTSKKISFFQTKIKTNQIFAFNQ